MAIDPDQIRALVQQPSEALQVELKTWIDPRTDDGVAKLIKAAFAIRNRNGGFLLIGFNNETRLPDPCPFDEPIEAIFHIDTLQAAISRYANPSFEVTVAFQAREGCTYPVIGIPEGVRVPAVVRRDLIGDGGKKLLAEGALYFRTFNANGTASSAHIKPVDYPDLLEVCFENREADIGRFLRRHLGGGTSANTFASALGLESKSAELRRRAFSVVEGGSDAADAAMNGNVSADVRARIAGALTMRVGLVLDPEKPDEYPTQEFLNKVSASNPNFTGWPVWLESRTFTNQKHRPYVSDGLWQALIDDLDAGWAAHFEFLRYDPRGAFYLQRVMQDDLTDKVEKGTALDAVLMIYRVAEVIAVGTNLGRVLGWDGEGQAGFAFRWTGLEGRSLRPWANALRGMGMGGGQSRSPSVDAFVEVPLETPYAALAPYVSAAVRPLFSLFDGYVPSAELVEKNVRELVERKMEG